MKKNIAALAMIMLSSLHICAEYKILQLNSPTITVDGKKLRAGDRFGEPGNVTWESDLQAMKVMDMTDKSQRVIVARQFRKSRAADLKAFLTQSKQMASRDGFDDNAVTLRHRLSGEHYLVDSLTFHTSYPTDEKHFFYVSFMDKGEEINKLVPNSEGAFTITRDIYTIDGEGIEPRDMTLTVYYLDDILGRLTLITDDMKVIPVPGLSD